MPYIEGGVRGQYDKVLDQMPSIGSKGELEYCIFKLMKTFMKDREWRYSSLHDTVYAAHHCGDEFRRRFLDKREDGAIATNGDVKIKDDAHD